ncbi:unnamed protein product [Clonostachys chloroleuca]|uniref:Major facilitator superfamily (MFS) profile domain-containing protein n=1 Tax=Clonostachys chloroleuca TaxID=1926264 RepID=A0AA35QCH1_9HYPO|nr:unnamed protein product [Clonostachys chloroleuca]
MAFPKSLAIPRAKDESGKAWQAILIGLFVAFGGVLFGYDTGTISGILAMPYWQKLFSTGYVDPDGNPNVTGAQESAIVSILSAGLMISTWVFNLGVVLHTVATAIPMFLAGRFFAGFGVGLISALGTAPKWIRGFVVGAYQWAITIGLLIAAIVNNATKHRDDSGSYRIHIGIQLAWSLILFGGMLFLPETPRYLIKGGRLEKATRALSRLRRLPADHEALRSELAEVQANHDFETSLGTGTYLDCFKPPILKRLLTGMGLQALQQLTVLRKLWRFKRLYCDHDYLLHQRGVYITCMYAYDKFGRRPLLLWGAIGMCVSQLIVAILGTVSTGQTDTGEIIVKNLSGQKAAVAFVCIYIFFFASTWGPLAWVVTGEIFPLKTRAKSLSITTATNWLLNWAIAYSTPYLVNYGDGYANLQSKIFFVWFGCCFLCIAFVWFMIYETKGLSLEQVDQLYEEVSNPRESSKWRPTTSWEDREVQGGHEKAVKEQVHANTVEREK